MSEQKKSDLYVLDTTGPTSRTSIGPFHAITPDKGGFRGAILDDGGNAFVFKMQYYSAPGMKGGFL